MPHSPKGGRIKEFLLDAREKRAQDRFPLGLFFTPLGALRHSPVGGRILLSAQCKDSAQRKDSAPVGKRSRAVAFAKADGTEGDEGGIPVCSFF